MSATKEELELIVERAVKVLQSFPPPAALADEEEKKKFHAIFDSPVSWKAMAKGSAVKHLPDPVTPVRPIGKRPMFSRV